MRTGDVAGGRFEVERLAGKGGMGAVYVARDRRIERDVAVKTLRADVFPSRFVIERFQREAKALAKLRHPNILPVYAVGEGSGLSFMITPRLTLRMILAFSRMRSKMTIVSRIE